jgi:branched-subunit amino acid transport protein
MIDWTLWNLLVVAVIGTCAWRFFGVIIAGRIDEKSPLFEWISCVAYAIAAGLMAKILLLPGGALSQTLLMDRTAGAAASIIVFFFLGRHLLHSLAAGVGLFVFFPYLRAILY